MKKIFLLAACLLSLFIPLTVFAANVTKVVITAMEPMVGERQSFEASVPATASTEVYEVLWNGEFDNGVFVQGRDYTMIVKLRIKASSSNVFSTSSKINVTINGHNAKVTKISEKYITVKYTWKTLGGENPNDPKYKLKTRLKELAAAYPATNASDDKELLGYLRGQLPTADIWSTGVSYRYTRKIPSETIDGNVSMPIGITYEGVTLENFNFTVVLPALNKSPEAAKLNADMELMKTALKNLLVTARTTGDDVLAAVNAASVNGTKAVWDDNYKYNAPRADLQGSIDGNLIFVLGNQKDIFHAHKTLPIAGDSKDAAIDADFSLLSKALHNFVVHNATTQQELLDVAMGAISNGSKLTLTSFSKRESTYDEMGRIILYFDLELDDKHRAPRISLPLPKFRAAFPAELDIIHDEWEVLRIVNVERHKNGCKPILMVAPLQEAANIRAEEHTKDCNIGHKRLDGSSCFTAIDSAFRTGRKLGENLAVALTPSIVMNNWMNSPGHRANILLPDYHFIGIGTTKDTSSKSWMQVFSSGRFVTDAVTNTGSKHFDTLYDMERAYLICTISGDATGYIPLDADYMEKNGNEYTIYLNGLSFSVTVGK